jgi:hypothetical protein
VLYWVTADVPTIPTSEPPISFRHSLGVMRVTCSSTRESHLVFPRCCRYTVSVEAERHPGSLLRPSSVQGPSSSKESSPGSSSSESSLSSSRSLLESVHGGAGIAFIHYLTAPDRRSLGSEVRSGPKMELTHVMSRRTRKTAAEVAILGRPLTVWRFFANWNLELGPTRTNSVLPSNVQFSSVFTAPGPPVSFPTRWPESPVHAKRRRDSTSGHGLGGTIVPG